MLNGHSVSLFETPGGHDIPGSGTGYTCQFAHVFVPGSQTGSV